MIKLLWKKNDKLLVAVPDIMALWEVAEVMFVPQCCIFKCPFTSSRLLKPFRVMRLSEDDLNNPSVCLCIALCNESPVFRYSLLVVCIGLSQLVRLAFVFVFFFPPLQNNAVELKRPSWSWHAECFFSHRTFTLYRFLLMFNHHANALQDSGCLPNHMLTCSCISML